ncbi:cytochrome P450 [Litoreibacter roseus]|uniref:Cytochrome P450 n=1 Tax=Litoreibacter roseus TaxID=2601869 RepID=A0A6N6JK42_9RHOB|nr:cytochrome P450 [Litoreibacter roseus]GFE66676.1 cytochrome P450 [Litoreibacter roseus]
MIPPKPESRADNVSFWKYLRLFRKDILSAQPARLYKAWLAEFRTPFFRSYLVNQPELIREILNVRPKDFPKSDRIGSGLAPLLGNSVFLTNGAAWARQRRIIDPAFEGGRLRDTYPAMKAAGEAACARLNAMDLSGPVEIEEVTSFLAADVIFRTLFSLPIEDEIAAQVFREFQTYQRQQPLLNLAAFLPRFGRLSPLHRRQTRKSAASIRTLIKELTTRRMAEIKAGTAPDDLATKIMLTPDPETGETFSTEEMVDQVAIFFLAGHETSASALAWSLYLLARSPDWQAKVSAEASDVTDDFGSVSRLKVSRDVFREALRLYPPVPMMVRETTRSEEFRKKKIAPSSLMVISPWHLHRHTRFWDTPDAFDPGRWNTENGKACQRKVLIPFSTGPRVCPGAGFAMIEGPLLLSMLVGAFRFEVVKNREPVPVAHLTVRAEKGIWLRLQPKSA